MDWFRMYHDVINDPKVYRLTIGRRWRWVELLCISSKAKDRGMLPGLEDIAFHLGVKLPEAESIMADMVRNGLVDQVDGGKRFAIHDWDEHQRKSDDVAERVRRHREAHKNNGVTLRERY